MFQTCLKCRRKGLMQQRCCRQFPQPSTPAASSRTHIVKRILARLSPPPALLGCAPAKQHQARVPLLTNITFRQRSWSSYNSRQSNPMVNKPGYLNPSSGQQKWMRSVDRSHIHRQIECRIIIIMIIWFGDTVRVIPICKLECCTPCRELPTLNQIEVHVFMWFANESSLH